MKKLFIFFSALAILFTALPFSASAYPGGLLAGRYGSFTDNNINTYGLIQSGKSFDFALPVESHISGFRMFAINGSGGLRVRFYNSSGTLVYTSPGLYYKGVDYNVTADVRNVKTARLTNEVGGWDINLSEFDVFAAGPPPMPTNVTYSFDSEGSVVLKWSPSVGAEGYNVYWDGEKINGNTMVKATTYTVTNPTSIVHTAQITAVDGAAESAKSTAISIDTTKPPAPPTVEASPGYGSAIVKWTSAPGASGYHVYVNGERITTSPLPSSTTSYTVPNLTNEQTYTISVTSVKSNGVESDKKSTTVTPDGTPPAKPNGFRATAGSGKAVLYWNENSEPDLAGYIIYLSGSKKTPTPIKANTYTINGLTDDVTYNVSVSAVDFVGNESPKATASVTPIPPDTTPPGKPTGVKATGGNREALVEWAKNPEPDTEGYYIWVDGVKKTGLIMGSYSYMVPGLANGSTYKIQVQAVDTSGNLSELSDPVSVLLTSKAPDRPKSLSVISGDGRVLLSWSATNSQDVKHYDIYRNGVKLATITGTNYEDTAIQNGKDYEYRVVAVNDEGESEPSIGFASPTKGLSDFTGTKLPFDVWGMLTAAVGFLKSYGVWILLALGVLFAFAMLDTPTKAVDKAAGNKGRKRNDGTVLVGDKRISKSEWNKESDRIRKEMYDYLTKTGRIKERDEWVAKTGNPYQPAKAKTAKAATAAPKEKRSREGLIAKQIPAERNGKKYMTTVYVKPENYRQGAVIDMRSGKGRTKK